MRRYYVYSQNVDGGSGVLVIFGVHCLPKNIRDRGILPQVPRLPLLYSQLTFQSVISSEQTDATNHLSPRQPNHQSLTSFSPFVCLASRCSMRNEAGGVLETKASLSIGGKLRILDLELGFENIPFECWLPAIVCKQEALQNEGLKS